MATLQVPDRERPSVIELTNLSQSRLDELDQLIEDAHADRPKTRDALRRFVTSPSEALSALVSMTAARLAHGMTPSELENMLRDSLGDTAGEGRLENLLDNASILRLAKRLDLETAYERGLHTFRILTDIRPVFDEDVSAGIGAALVSHVIQLTYLQDNQFREIYIAADLADLQLIRSQVDRAIEKGEAADKLIRKAGATVLATGTGEA